MNIACIIPARGGSKGIPKKNLLSLCGKPLLAWSIEQALGVVALQDKVYVSSDCDEILAVASDFGAKDIKRPEALSGDRASSESALLHAIEAIEAQQGRLDAVLFLQATSPLRDSADIDNAITNFQKDRLDSLFSATILEDFFIWKKNKAGQFKSFNYDYQSRKIRQDVELQYVENGSIYMFKPDLLRKTNNRLGGKIGVSIMDPWKVHEIDSADDVDLCDYYMTKKIIKNRSK